MHRSSVDAFRCQHKLRLAQNARDRVMKLFLVSEADIRGFAATGDPYLPLVIASNLNPSVLVFRFGVARKTPRCRADKRSFRARTLRTRVG
jgi:hypothetical protein